MSISAKVRFNEGHERKGIDVNARGVVGLEAHFTMEGSTAVLTSVQERDGEESVYGDNLSYVMDYVEDLPFVQAVTLDEYEDPETGQ